MSSNMFMCSILRNVVLYSHVRWRVKRKIVEKKGNLGLLHRKSAKRLREGEAGFAVHDKDLLNGSNVGSSTKIETKVVLHGRLHDVPC